MRSAITFVFLLFLSAMAHAQVFRAYLSSAGSDLNNTTCSLAAPCRLLPAALGAIADGGEVWMLDTANYNTGTVSITKSVSIVAAPGVLGSILSVAAGGNAIDITLANAGTKVVLRNLVIVPEKVGFGANGINMTSGASLTVENCLIANLQGSGIYVDDPASVRVTNTTVRGNASDGIRLQGGARATLTRAIVGENGGSGIVVAGTHASTTTADIADSTADANALHGFVAYSDSPSTVVKVSVRDSRAVRNASAGVVAQLGTGGVGSSISLSASNNVISNNGNIGIAVVNPGSKVWSSGNTVSDNTSYGLYNSGGLLESAGNNAVRNNGINAFGTVTPIATM
jgi:hypothetical protein